MSPPQTVDLLLSSGFLAFARHAGFLQAIDEAREQAGLEVGAVVGTSSGSLTGALWCAGWSPEDLLAELSATAPLRRIGLHLPVWKGVFTMDPVVAHLRQVLPATFAELERPFAVGVADPVSGAHVLLTEGDLPAAIAASCAMPHLFQPVLHGTQPYMDGGAVDRVGVDAWRTWRPNQRAILHLVERSHGPVTDADLSALTVVQSPRSGAKLWNLGDVQGQREESLQRAREVLAGLG